LNSQFLKGNGKTIEQFLFQEGLCILTIVVILGNIREIVHIQH